jgi:crotonobetainyl-CoA:carnitine CoA-transferase CaiB-like acyl-CoA transferase
MAMRIRQGPLHGVRVLELAGDLAGACAAGMLGELGATVTKVWPELPGRDGPDPQLPDGRYVGDHYDRHKAALVIDIDDADGAELVTRLAHWAQILIVSPGSGLGRGARFVDLVRRASTDLIDCSITTLGPGTDEPGAGSELVAEALSGCLDLTGEEGFPPYPMGIPVCDLVAGVYGVLGTVAALTSDQRGVSVEISKLEVGVALLSYMAVGYFADGEVPTRVGTGHSTIFPYNAFRAADGEVVVAPFTQRFWRNFCVSIGRADLLERPEYRNFAGRVAGKRALLAELEPVLQTRTVREWVAIFAEGDVPAGPVLPVRDALELDHTQARGLTPLTSVGGHRFGRVLGSPFNVQYVDGTTYRAPGSGPQPSWTPATRLLIDLLSASEQVTRQEVW